MTDPLRSLTLSAGIRRSIYYQVQKFPLMKNSNNKLHNQLSTMKNSPSTINSVTTTKITTIVLSTCLRQQQVSLYLVKFHLSAHQTHFNRQLLTTALVLVLFLLLRHKYQLLYLCRLEKQSLTFSSVALTMMHLCCLNTIMNETTQIKNIVSDEILPMMARFVGKECLTVQV